MFSTLGYDEEFSGNYGYEDIMFKAFNRRINNKIRYYTRWKKIISSGIDRDDSYHTLERDSAVNKKLLAKKLALLKGNDPFISHSRLFLNFNYQKVKESWL